MDSRVTLVLASAVALGALVQQGGGVREPLQPLLTKVNADVSAGARQTLEKSIVYVAVAAYSKAADELARTQGAKTMCNAITTRARAHLTSALNSKLAGFGPEAVKGLRAATDAMARVLDAFVRKTHCTNAAAAIQSVKDATALRKQLADLKSQFTTGVA